MPIKPLRNNVVITPTGRCWDCEMAGTVVDEYDEFLCFYLLQWVSSLALNGDIEGVESPPCPCADIPDKMIVLFGGGRYIKTLEGNRLTFTRE